MDVRTDCDSRIHLCKHISIKAYESNDSCAEYVESVVIHCGICNKDFSIGILVN